MSNQQREKENIDREGLLQVLETLKKRYWLLKVQAATEGSRVDPAITIQIEELERAIEKAEEDLSQWGQEKQQILESEPKNLGVRVHTKGTDEESTESETVYGQGKRWAVLVGINAYEDPYITNLKVCVDDVTAIKQSLVKNYQITKLLTDNMFKHLPTRANILGELSTIAQMVDIDDLLLFYFSGHGKDENGESYLLSRDTRLSALKHTALAMHDVREIMEQSPARAKVIILDACHSGASTGKDPSIMTPEFIQRVFEEAEGIAVLASCKQKQQSWEWYEKNSSVFTYYLLEALTGKADSDGKGFITISDVSRYVTDGVRMWAANKGVPQTPTLQYTVAGDIILLEYDALN